MSIDIIIVTKDRYKKLLRCVSSLLSNSVLPKTIIIIHSKEEEKCLSKQQIVRLCKRVGVSLQYIHVKDKGISYSRNIGMQYVKNTYFAFIDDDEIAPDTWIEQGRHLINTHKDNVDVISGPKVPNYNDNYWNKLWGEIYKPIYDKEQTPVDFVTSSNSFYRTSFIKRNKIAYDSSFGSSSEDRVFSFRLKEKKGRMRMFRSLYVYHDFRTNFTEYALQWFGYAKSLVKYEFVYKNVTVISAILNFNTIKKQGLSIDYSRVPASLFLGLVLTDSIYYVGMIVQIIATAVSFPVLNQEQENQQA